MRGMLSHAAVVFVAGNSLPYVRWRVFRLFAIGLIVASGIGMRAEGQESRPAALKGLPFTAVKVEDSFWAPRIRLNREKVLPHNIEFCYSTGRIANFDKAAGVDPGAFKGIFYDDSDVYKVLEGAAASLAHGRDETLEKTIDTIIGKIAAAQRPDGYLYTFYTVSKQLDQRYSDMPKMHELYCAGHLIEAAIAYHQSTGKRKLLDVAIKLADHIDSVFGPGKRRDIDGHQEIELALIKLSRHTGDQKYFKLAEFFINERGNNADNHRKPQGDYAQDHKPLRQQEEIAGHAVRAMYFYSAATDLAAVSPDKELIGALDKLWRDVVERKMYVTGGIGPSAHNEGFTVPYDLPNDSAYAETCAAVGMVLWNHRLNLLHADARYADVMERSMYNGLISGVALSGQRFFYVNPLASRGRHHRREWFSTSCCPTNVVRFLPTVGGYAYATNGDRLFVNLFINGAASAEVKGTKVELKQETQYPWEGLVKLSVSPKQPVEFSLNVRIPGWCRNATLKLNGEAHEMKKEKGYAVIARTWKSGDVIELNMLMPVERVKSHPNVKANVGRTALQRGPLIYCLEAADNGGGNVRSLALAADSTFETEHRGDLLGGVTLIKGKARRRTGQGNESEAVSFTAVPYYSWDNRSAGQMVVWLPDDVSLAEPPVKQTLAYRSKASASHTWQTDTVEALNDQIEPKSSNDHSIPRFTWWDKRGGTQWVQYDFGSAQKVSAAEVYWFEDAPNGGCRVPKAWKVLFKDGEQWKPVGGMSAAGVKANEYDRATFNAVETTGLRIEAELQEGYSGGILEWKVE
jgi:hypothetical protein